MEKLILHEVLKCPYCWATIDPDSAITEKVEQGFFVTYKKHWDCPQCKQALVTNDFVLVKEPNPVLWARRFSL